MLWKECNQQCIDTGKIISLCIYTGNEIKLADLFNNRFDVEHTIPFSRCFDNSFANKFLCEATENRNVKKNQTPYETYSGNKERWEKIQQRLNRLYYSGKIHRGKYERFLIKGNKLNDLLDDFVSRQLNDTRYIATESKDYLQQLGCKVQTTQGRLTGFLRKSWGLNEILKNKLTENNETDNKQDKKNRNDHRHHAIDAIVVALTNLRLLQKISTILARVGKLTTYENDSKLAPYQNFWKDTKQKIDKIIISHSKNKDDWVKGALHEDTAYGKVQTKKGEKYTRRIPLTSLNNSRVKKIADKEVKKIIKKRLCEHNNDFKTAFVEELNHKNGNIIKSVKLIENLSNLVPIEDKNNTPYKYYAAGSNHHLLIFENLKTGKKEEEIVTTFTAAKRKAKGESVIQKEKKGYKCILFFKQNDIFHLTGEKDNKDITGYYRVQKFSKGDYHFRYHSRLEAGSEKKGLLRCGHNIFLKYKPKKVEINPIGQITKIANN